VCRAVDRQQVLHVDLGVPLRGRQLDVPEQFLDGAQVGAALEQVRGERVA
jgi:hypothetical protein